MKIGFIDYYLDEWHANNYPKLIAEASNGETEVTLAYALVDSPLPGGRTTDAWCADMNIRRAHSIEEVIAECDGLIVLSPDNCEMHEQLCELPLKSGKPTYIDKTFAPDLQTAQRIFANAETSKTPCYSTSALRFAAEYQGIEQVSAISAWGPGKYETYSIHQIEPIMMLMKAKAARVMAHVWEGTANLMIEFEDKRYANLTCFESGSPFAMNICASGGNKATIVESDFFRAFIAELVTFFQTQSAPVPHQDTLDIMAVRGAGLKALETPGEWISL